MWHSKNTGKKLLSCKLWSYRRRTPIIGDTIEGVHLIITDLNKYGAPRYLLIIGILLP